MSKKKYSIQSGIIFPVCAAVIVTIAVCVSLPRFADKFPFSQKPAIFSEYETDALKQVDSNQINSFDELKKNTIIGSAVVDETEFPLVYNADDVNEAGKLNVRENSALFGDVGCTYIHCKKNDAKAIKLLSNGSIVKIEAATGSFSYKIVKTAVVKNDFELNAAADGVGRAIAIYTDNSVGAGISDENFVAIGQLVE